MIYTIEELKFGGKYHDAFWTEKNPFAYISICLANCTCMVVGDCLATGDPIPISQNCNANNFHKNLANGWIAIPFNPSNVEVGDILEWTDGVHVARVGDIVNGKILVNSSWYTGIHGVAVYNKEWDIRPFNSKKEVSDFMSSNYPTRFYHCWDLERENSGIGYAPKYILKMPNVFPSEAEDKNKDQIYVSTNEQNVRQTPNGIILGTAQKGYYDVISKAITDHVWYETRYGYIAGVEGRVEFIEADIDLKKRIAELERLNKKYLNAIEKAKKDLEV